MRTLIGTMAINPTCKIELTPYRGGESREIGPVMGDKNVSPLDLVLLASNSGRIFWHVDNNSAQANRQWIVPAESVIAGGDDTNVSAYATEDPGLIILDLRNFDARYLAVNVSEDDDVIYIIDLCDDTYFAATPSKYDIFLCTYPQATVHLPVPLWDNKTGTYSFEESAWVKPTIKSPKPEET